MRTMKLAAVALAASLSLQGCYGSFAATRILHRWNGEITDSRLVNTLVFWALVIVPVYGVFTLGDGLVINVIEFWSGENPLKDAKIKGPKFDTPEEVKVEHGGMQFSLRMNSDGSVVISRDGVVVGTAMQTPDGGLAINDTYNGRAVSVTSAQLSRLRAVLAPVP